MKALLKFIVLVLCISVPSNAYTQTWIWGDSCRIDWINGSPVVSKANCSGEISSILHTPTGFFYVDSPNKLYSGPNQGRVYSNNGIQVSSPLGIYSQQKFTMVEIVPFPGDSIKAYIFHTSNAQNGYNLYYSTLDLYANGGSGALLTRNTRIVNDDLSGMSMGVIRHGNGRDWWVYVRQCNSATWTVTNLWYRFLIDPQGIHGPYTQNIGQLSYFDIDQLIFSPDGTKAVYLTQEGLFDMFEIDRCTGVFFNHQSILLKSPSWPNPPSALINYSRNGEFSESGRYFYTSAGINGAPDTNYVLQFDMLDSNIALSRKIIYQFNPQVQGNDYYPGQLKRGPDNKIYLAGYSYGHPYSDTCCYDTLTMYLSVINSPDSAGLACNFTPFSFYLGGNRTYSCLPDIPNYQIGPAVGSGCDTLLATSLSDDLLDEAQSFIIWPNPATSNIFLRWGGKEKIKQVSIYAMNGSKIISIPWLQENDYGEISLQNISTGSYFIEMQLMNGKRMYRKCMVMKE
jgi:Secretion system C-terminal sorting domain